MESGYFPRLVGVLLDCPLLYGNPAKGHQRALRLDDARLRLGLGAGTQAVTLDRRSRLGPAGEFSRALMMSAWVTQRRGSIWGADPRLAARPGVDGEPPEPEVVKYAVFVARMG